MVSQFDRVRAAESAVKSYSGKPFAWGQHDCLRMVAHALRAVGRAPPLRDAGQYRTLLGARKALRRTGFPSLSAWVDSWGLQPIPPSAAMAGDVLAFPSDVEDMPALALALSNGRILACVPAIGSIAVVSVGAECPPLAAWRA